MRVFPIQPFEGLEQTGGDDRDDHRHTLAGDAPVRAVQYVRMSTEHQQYSTENQADAIRQYADRHGFEIVRTYADEGRSGLRLEGRDALKRLIADVESGAADFSTILVYIVRFVLALREVAFNPTNISPCRPALRGAGASRLVGRATEPVTRGRGKRWAGSSRPALYRTWPPGTSYRAAFTSRP